MDTKKTIGRYEIIEELGHGAMGTVYRAKDPAMDRVVAVKTILSLAIASEQGSEFRERFYREARASGALAHPGIVAVFDVGEHEGLPFLVMEFVQGRTLDDAIRRGERPTLDRVCEIGQQIAEALGHAHQHGVVHRDIKPANILLTSREVYGIERPKITDFGVAKLTAGQITQSGQMLGTPAFMPPEQFTGAPVDGRADIFSLGVILYWMATGDLPFPGETMTSVSYKVVQTEPVPPRKLNPAITAELEAIILKCLAKSPADRYQTGGDLARDLAAVRGGARATNVQLQSAVPQTSMTGNSSFEATLDSHPSVASFPATGSAGVRQSAIAVQPAIAAPPQPAAKAAAAKPNNNLAVLAVAAFLALVIGGWAMMRHRAANPAVNSAAAVPAPTAPAPATPAAEAPPAPSDSSAAAAPSAPDAAGAPVPPVASKSTAAAAPKKTLAPSAPKAPAAASSAQPAALPPQPAPVAAPPSPVPPPAAAPAPAAVDFDPRTLDAKENARLKIDAGHMPAGMEFTVSMNGKVYFHRAAGDAKPEEDDLFVPPGIQEFQATAKSGANQRTSNTVSIDFKAKKRNTLTIELRLQGKDADAGTPNDLYANSQLVVTLK